MSKIVLDIIILSWWLGEPNFRSLSLFVTMLWSIIQGNDVTICQGIFSRNWPDGVSEWVSDGQSELYRSFASKNQGHFGKLFTTSKQNGKADTWIVFIMYSFYLITIALCLW